MKYTNNSTLHLGEKWEGLINPTNTRMVKTYLARFEETALMIERALRISKKNKIDTNL